MKTEKSPWGFLLAMGLGTGAAVAALSVWMAVRARQDPDPEEPVFLLPPSGSSGTETAYVNGKKTTITLTDIGNGKKLRSDAAAAYLAMRASAAADGVTLSPNSAFRTMAEQERLYSLYLKGKGNLAARPGYSNHQGGISLDLNSGTGVSGYLSKVYRWLFLNAKDFGFKNDVRGEPWHWTYYGR